MIIKVEYEVYSNCFMSFTYTDESNNVFLGKCHIEGWNKDTILDDELVYKSKYPINECYDCCYLNKNNLKKYLDSIAFAIINEPNIAFFDNDLIKIFSYLPILLGEVMSDSSFIAYQNRISNELKSIKMEKYTNIILFLVTNLLRKERK